MSNSPNPEPADASNEQPLLRVEFTTPLGARRQATISTDWSEQLDFRAGLFTGNCAESVRFRSQLTHAVMGLCATADCVFASLSLIQTLENGTRLLRLTEAMHARPKPQLRLVQTLQTAAKLALVLVLYGLGEFSSRELLHAAAEWHLP